MKRSFEELATLDHDIIVQRSHIVHSTLDDVVNKKFEKFNPVKAKGIASTLENEFNIDMSSWLNEYNNFRNNKEESVSVIDKMALEAIQENKAPRKKIYVTVGATLGVLVMGYYLTTHNPFSGFIKEQNMTEEQFKNDINKTEEANATNTALNQIVDANGSSLPNVAVPGSDINNTIKPDQNKSAIKPVENNKTSNQTQQTAVQTKIVIESTKKLWYKVKNLDDNKTEENTVEPGKLEIDASKTKIITLGHQQVKLSYGQTVVEPKAGAKIRYLLKDKKLTTISEEEEYRLQGKSMHKPKTDKPQ